MATYSGWRENAVAITGFRQVLDALSVAGMPESRQCDKYDSRRDGLSYACHSQSFTLSTGECIEGKSSLPTGAPKPARIATEVIRQDRRGRAGLLNRDHYWARFYPAALVPEWKTKLPSFFGVQHHRRRTSNGNK